MNSWKIIPGLLCCSCIVLLAKSPDSDLFSDLNHETFLPRDVIERNAILLGENLANLFILLWDMSHRIRAEGDVLSLMLLSNYRHLAPCL